MSKHAKSPARPSFNPKPRRRARRTPIERWKLGLSAGSDYLRAVLQWRDRPEAEALFDRSYGAGPKARAVKRLGSRIHGPFAGDGAAPARKRRRRNNAALSQEARRRGVFRLRGPDFDPSAFLER